MNGTKIMAICCLTITLCVSICLIPENTNLLWGLFAALCSTIGVPVVATGVRTIRGKL